MIQFSGSLFPGRDGLATSFDRTFGLLQLPPIVLGPSMPCLQLIAHLYIYKILIRFAFTKNAGRCGTPFVFIFCYDVHS
jgi:hypothetical protein